MGARFKCKKCKKTFNINDGREAIQALVDECPRSGCQFKGKNLAYIPLKSIKKQTLSLRPEVTVYTKPSSNDDDQVVEYYEEEPIGGLISHRELRKKHGW